MKKFILGLSICMSLLSLSSCEKDEGKLPNISFKTGSGYTASDVSLAGSSAITIGINASKAEDKDVLKKFNVSKSINGGSGSTVFEKSLSGSEADNYSYDLNTSVDTVQGQRSKYTFTVTNRDGLSNQVSLTVTTQ